LARRVRPGSWCRRRQPSDTCLSRHERQKSLGAREAAKALELSGQCDIVHLCVTASPQVEALLRGPDDVIASVKRGFIVIDCSTSSPVSRLAFSEEMRVLA